MGNLYLSGITLEQSNDEHPETRVIETKSVILPQPQSEPFGFEALTNILNQ